MQNGSNFIPGHISGAARMTGCVKYLKSIQKPEIITGKVKRVLTMNTPRGNSIITSRTGGRRVYTFFVILHDGKLGGGWYLTKMCDITVKKISMKYFCVIKEKIVYMECVIQNSMFYSFYLFLSILLCNVDSVLVSDLNAYI